MFGNRRNARLRRTALSDDNALSIKGRYRNSCLRNYQTQSSGYVLAWDVLLSIVLLASVLAALPASFQSNETGVNSYHAMRLTQDVFQQLIDKNRLNDLNAERTEVDLNHWLEPQWKHFAVLQKFDFNGTDFTLRNAAVTGTDLNAFQSWIHAENFFVDLNGTNDVNSFGAVSYWVGIQ